jgi:hypothetical protein
MKLSFFAMCCVLARCHLLSSQWSHIVSLLLDSRVRDFIDCREMNNGVRGSTKILESLKL